MMNTKPVSIFDDEPAPAPRPTADALRALAESSGFPSRQADPAPPPPAKSAPWRYRTGRTEQFNVKASAATLARCEALARRINGPKAVVLELALDALERALDAAERAGGP
jgi:hypothetical protein